MPNLNNVANVIAQQNNGVPLVLTNPITSAKNFVLANGAVAALNIPNPAVILAGEAFPEYSLSAIPFSISIGGYFTAGTTATITLQLCLGVVAGTTPVFSPSASQSLVSVSDNFSFSGRFFWDPVSTNLRGNMSGWVGTTTSSAVLSTVQTPAALSNLVFSLNAIFSASNSSNVVYVTEFGANLA
jgi:hypothetical protein